MKWYYAVAAGPGGAQQAGPVDDSELDRLIQSGIVRLDTLVWRDGMPSWQALSAARPILPPTVNYSAFQAPQPQASSVGYDNPPYVAQPIPPPPQYNPQYPQQSFQQPFQQSFQNFRYAGFWIRFLARFIDGIILFVVQMLIRIPLMLLFGLGTGLGSLGMGRGDDLDGVRGGLIGMGFVGLMGLSFLIGIAVAGAYEVYFVSSRGATPGKMALGLKIVHADGSPLSTGQALGRFLAAYLSGAILMIGYIMAGFDAQKRALHDMICNTRVIKVR